MVGQLGISHGSMTFEAAPVVLVFLFQCFYSDMLSKPAWSALQMLSSLVSIYLFPSHSQYVKRLRPTD